MYCPAFNESQSRREGVQRHTVALENGQDQGGMDSESECAFILFAFIFLQIYIEP